MVEEFRKLKTLAKSIKPLIRIGKNGVSGNVIEELKRLLKKYHLVKIKVLKAAPIEGKDELKKMAQSLARETDSQVVLIIGNTFTLYFK
jgi:RNA-binding protein